MARERARLQELVTAFAGQLVWGRPCTYFDQATGKRTPAQYRTDKKIECLTIVPSRGAPNAQVVCPLGVIQDIYCFVYDGEACFPPKIVSNLKPNEAELLLMVVYAGTDGEAQSFCILEESSDSRDTFMECMRILSVYAKAAYESIGSD